MNSLLTPNRRHINYGSAGSRLRSWRRALMPLALLLVSLACTAHCGWSANNFTLVSDCFRKETVGSMTGLAGFAGGVGGVLITGVVPTILIESFGYSPIFILMGILHPIAFVIMNLLIKRDGSTKVEL